MLRSGLTLEVVTTLAHTEITRTGSLCESYITMTRSFTRRLKADNNRHVISRTELCESRVLPLRSINAYHRQG